MSIVLRDLWFTTVILLLQYWTTASIIRTHQDHTKDASRLSGERSAKATDNKIKLVFKSHFKIQ